MQQLTRQINQQIGVVNHHYRRFCLHRSRGEVKQAKIEYDNLWNAETTLELLRKQFKESKNG